MKGYFIMLDKFIPLCQHPELPTGCEITALAMVLYNYGFDADKCELAEKYLDKGKTGETDFNCAFVGEPSTSYSYGCYAPVIVNAANRFLESKASELRAWNISGKELNELFEFTAMDIPVMIWCTIGMKKGYYSTEWVINGKKLRWYACEHCTVLLGKNGDESRIADPYTGRIEKYRTSLLETRYDELFRQSVIIC